MFWWFNYFGFVLVSSLLLTWWLPFWFLVVFVFACCFAVVGLAGVIVFVYGFVGFLSFGFEFCLVVV